MSLDSDSKSRRSAGPSKDDSSVNDLSSGSSLTRLQPLRTGSLERLPSVRPKRDLTLGGVRKKTFSPTIPIRREKKDPVDIPLDAPPTASKERGKPRDSPKGDGSRKRTGDKKERKRKREKDFITSASVFSMGPAERSLDQKRESLGGGGRGGGGGGKGWSKSVKKDKVFVKNHKFHHLEDHEEPMDADPSDSDLFSHSRMPPVQLPLDYSRHVRHRTVLPKQVKVKQEPVDEEDFPPIKPVKVKPIIGPPAPVKQHRITAAELFTPTEDPRGQFLFFQLPDSLPISVETSEEEPMEVEGASSQTTSKDEAQRHFSLLAVPEGMIGKLRIHKSGKVKLVLGETTLDVAMGTSCGFLQELVCVRTNQDSPEMTVLGQLSHRLVCTPDFEAMLASKR